MHIFYAHQNDQSAGGHLPAPDGSGNRRLRDAEKVGQIGSRMLTDNEFKPFHLSVENLVFHSSLSMAVLWVRPTIDSQKNYNSRSIS